MYGDAGVLEVDRVAGSLYSADPRVDRHHLISISSYHTMKIHTSIFPNIWSHSVCPRFHGFSTPGSIISSHLIPMLREPEPLFLINSIWMSREVWQSVDGGISAF